jgi:hypothetical protein
MKNSSSPRTTPRSCGTRRHARAAWLGADSAGELGVPKPRAALHLRRKRLAKARHAARLHRPAGAGRRLRPVRRRTSAARPACSRHAMPASRNPMPQQRKAARELGEADRARALRLGAVFVRHADDPQPIIAEGEWHGEILPPRAATMASATTRCSTCRSSTRPPPNSTPPRKNRRSHRGQALQPNWSSACKHVAEIAGAMARIIPIPAAGSRRGGARPQTAWNSATRRRCRSTCISLVRAEVPLLRLQLARGRRRHPEGDYIAALIADLESALPLVWGRRVAQHLHRRRHAQPAFRRGRRPAAGRLPHRLPLLPDAEITLEANPGTVEAESSPPFAPPASIACRSASRASTRAPQGARPHPRRRRSQARHRMAATHFDNFNLDLMYGLPGRRWPRR